MRLELDRIMFDLIKKTIRPPYKSRDLYSIFVALFIMLLIPLTVLQATKAQDDRTNASVLPAQKLNQDIIVKITTPVNNETVKDTIDVSVEASDAKDNISSINLYFGNKLLAIVKNPSLTNSFTTKISFDTTKEKNGPNSLAAFAYSSSGEQNKSDSVAISLSNSDNTPPAVSFDNLKDGSYVSGSSFLAKVTARDESGISLVSIYLDESLQRKFVKVPYTTSIDLSNITPGNHTLTAKARDTAGNETKTSVEFYKGVKNITK